VRCPQRGKGAGEKTYSIAAQSWSINRHRFAEYLPVLHARTGHFRAALLHQLGDQGAVP
jgi:hypothetical protein